MRITSMDISNKEFKKGIRGYSSADVDEFLDKIAEDYELLYKENSYLKEKVTALTEKIEHYSKIENTIQNTLLLAQSAAEQTNQNTQKEAELIIKTANETSQKIIDKSNYNVMKINDEYDTVKQEFLKFRSKFRNFMNAQIEMFNGLEEDIEHNYNVGSLISENNSIKSQNTIVEESVAEKEIETGILNNKDIIKVNEDQATRNPIEEIKNFFVKNE
jgi:cell division initiation protein